MVPGVIRQAVTDRMTAIVIWQAGNQSPALAV